MILKTKFITSLAILIFITSTSLASKEIETYSKETCQSIYETIETFLILADMDWKEKK